MAKYTVIDGIRKGVGDKVWVKTFERLKADSHDTIRGDPAFNRCHFVNDMKRLCGKLITIAEINTPYLKIKEEGELHLNGYGWVREMLTTADPNLKRIIDIPLKSTTFESRKKLI